MIKEEFNFDDERNGGDTTVFVQTAHVRDPNKSKKGRTGLYLCLLGDNAWSSTAAYIPRKEAKKIIKAMKAVLDEE